MTELMLDTHAFLWFVGDDYHRDPFDRLLVCQAQLEKLVIVGRDQAFDACGIARLW